MKKILALALLGAAIALAPVTPAHAQYTAIQGIYIDGSTNTVAVGGSNAIVCRVMNAATNTYNLSAVLQAQSDTNAHPALPLCNRGLGSRLLALSIQSKATASTSGLTTVRLGASVDGASWQSNWLTFTITANGTSVVPFATNVDTYAFPFIALQSIENTNATAVITNITITASAKPGI